MSASRRLARPMLAAIFVNGGLNTLREPSRVAKAAERVGVPIAEKVPGLPTEPETLVRINGGVQFGAGVLLALGRMPRLASLALLGTLVPTTAAGHRFWEEDDDVTKANQRIHFLKNLGLAGGLLIAAFDTDGKPSIGWRAARRAQRSSAKAAAGRAAATAVTQAVARSAAKTASSAATTAAQESGPAVRAGRDAAREAARVGRSGAGAALQAGRSQAGVAVGVAREEAKVGRRAAKAAAKSAAKSARAGRKATSERARSLADALPV